MSQASLHADEVRRGDRFEFGANWARFLSTLNHDRIELAKGSLREKLGDIRGLRFLDAGSGSGLFSLAARRLGAIVHSFDYDPQSVACTAELRNRYAKGDPNWAVEEGSVLDRDYLAKLGTFDIVYSWGVLHHTGNMWQAFDNVVSLVVPGGRLFISIYNDQGWKSRYWRIVKSVYNRSIIGRFLLHLIHMPAFIFAPLAYRALTGRLREARNRRGMARWYDYLDWMGGYPYEVASVAALRSYFEPRGFFIESLHEVTSPGCNELVLKKSI